MGISQGSVLRPTLFVLFANDLPFSVPSGSVYMHADDTTIYCVGKAADLVIDRLNKALREFYNWSLNNRLTQGATDGAYRSGVPRKFSIKFGYQVETVS